MNAVASPPRTPNRARSQRSADTAALPQADQAESRCIKSGNAPDDAVTGPLKVKHHSVPGLKSLFFASRRTSAGEFDYWHVPASGGWDGGTITGQAMALAYLKLVNRDATDPKEAKYWLGEIICSLMDRTSAIEAARPPVGSPEFEGWMVSRQSLRGQQWGFMETVGLFVWSEAQFANSKLRCFADENLVRQANRGLAYPQSTGGEST